MDFFLAVLERLSTFYPIKDKSARTQQGDKDSKVIDRQKILSMIDFCYAQSSTLIKMILCQSYLSEFESDDRKHLMHKDSPLEVLLACDTFLIETIKFLDDSSISALISCCRNLKDLLYRDLVWKNLWMHRFGDLWQNIEIQRICTIRSISWQPDQSPNQGWFLFYQQFQVCWQDWLLAGACTRDYCLIGLFGSIFNVTKFLPNHPGSEESLTDSSGGDATEHFLDIGHSIFAFRLAQDYIIWEPNENSHFRKHSRQFEARISRDLEDDISFHYRKVSKIGMEMKRQRLKILSIAKSMQYAASSNEQGWLSDAMRNVYSFVHLNDKLFCTVNEISSLSQSHSCSYLVQLSHPVICQEHYGQMKAFWDPVQECWIIWHSCCSKIFGFDKHSCVN